MYIYGHAQIDSRKVEKKNFSLLDIWPNNS